jgi:AraC-like DNA-binding protein
MGKTIPQYIRDLRMERAAEMLKTGKYNVTQVAFAVGYSSASHFSTAFHQSFGCCPGLYPLKPMEKIAAAKRITMPATTGKR